MGLVRQSKELGFGNFSRLEIKDLWAVGKKHWNLGLPGIFLKI